MSAVPSGGNRVADTTPGQRFIPELAAGLPQPARRWLSHVVAPGTPLWSSVELTMHGQIRLRGWRPYRAWQVLAPPHGFIWAARTRVAGLPVSGFDRYGPPGGEMRWRLLGMLPIMNGSGRDISRSAGGRLAAEGVSLLPTSFPEAVWTAGPNPDIAVATWRIGDQDEAVHLRIDPDGRLREILIDRWGNPDGEPYGRYPFGVSIQAERTFDGVTIPSAFRAGWWWGTDRQNRGEFFRATITSATFR